MTSIRLLPVHLLLPCILLTGCGSESEKDAQGSGGQQNQPIAAQQLPLEGEDPQAADQRRLEVPKLTQLRKGRVTSTGDVIADTFAVRYDLRGDRLTLVLDTDLPDRTPIAIDLERIYRVNENREEYPIDYISEVITAGELRSGRVFSVDDDKWKRELERRKKLLASAGEPFSVRRINDEMTLSVRLIGQKPPLEKWNKNLRGKVVQVDDDGWRGVRRTFTLKRPMDASDLQKTRWADPLNLAVGHTYKLTKRTPLAPLVDSPNPLITYAQIRQMPPGTYIRVSEVVKERDIPQYRVEAITDGKVVDVGWVASAALLGQDVIEMES